MSGKSFVLLICSVFFIMLSGTEVRAIGLGAYFDGGFGIADRLDEDQDKYHEQDNLHLGFGFVFEANVIKNRVTSYRFNLGLEHVSFDDDEYNITSFAIDNTLGIGLYKTAATRIWIGPELKMLWGDGEFWYSICPVVGINLSRSDEIAYSLSLGYTGEGRIKLLDSSDAPEEESQFFFDFSVLFKRNDVY
ncbi:hypothetical protein JXQ70_20800 [bacterium]|nr:hypothetical protein [bacterium]